MLTIALSKGRILDDTLPLLAEAGIVPTENPDKSRKLIIPTYEALVATPDGLGFAEQIFVMAKPGYHPITTATVEALLAKAKAAPAQ